MYNIEACKASTDLLAKEEIMNKFFAVGLLIGAGLTLAAMIFGPNVVWGLLFFGLSAIALDRVVTCFARIS